MLNWIADKLRGASPIRKIVIEESKLPQDFKLLTPDVQKAEIAGRLTTTRDYAINEPKNAPDRKTVEMSPKTLKALDRESVRISKAAIAGYSKLAKLNEQIRDNEYQAIMKKGISDVRKNAKSTNDIANLSDIEAKQNLAYRYLLAKEERIGGYQTSLNGMGIEGTKARVNFDKNITPGQTRVSKQVNNQINALEKEFQKGFNKLEKEHDKETNVAKKNINQLSKNNKAGAMSAAEGAEEKLHKNYQQQKALLDKHRTHLENIGKYDGKAKEFLEKKSAAIDNKFKKNFKYLESKYQSNFKANEKEHDKGYKEKMDLVKQQRVQARHNPGKIDEINAAGKEQLSTQKLDRENRLNNHNTRLNRIDGDVANAAKAEAKVNDFNTNRSKINDGKNIKETKQLNKFDKKITRQSEKEVQQEKKIINKEIKGAIKNTLYENSRAGGAIETPSSEKSTQILKDHGLDKGTTGHDINKAAQDIKTQKVETALDPAAKSTVKLGMVDQAKVKFGLSDKDMAAVNSETKRLAGALKKDPNVQNKVDQTARNRLAEKNNNGYQR